MSSASALSAAPATPTSAAPTSPWHVSPVVDLLAYHLSWLWILVPLLLAGGDAPADWLVLWSVGITVSFLHRHWTMPYVYLDPQVYGQHRTRFSLLFGLLMLAVVASANLMPWRAPPAFLLPADGAMVVAATALLVQLLRVDRRGAALSSSVRAAVFAPYGLAVVCGLWGTFVPHHGGTLAAVLCALAMAALVLWRAAGGAGAMGVVVLASTAGLLFLALGLPALPFQGLRGRDLVAPFALIAALWNVWHTLMQKYGILRLYAAKSAVPVERRTPGAVDRLLLLSWIPLLTVVVGPAQREAILKRGASVKEYLLPMVDASVALRPFLLLPGALLVLAALALFAHHERKSGAFSAPRWSMALSMTLLNASFLVVSPVKVYIAYGFSHAIEYMVFVLAFQRRRYAVELPHKPLLGRLLRHPLWAYGLPSLLIAAVYFFVEFGDDWGFRAGKVMLLGLSASTWLFAFAIWHSMAHFWYDGFLWKMRLPTVRQSL